MKRAKQPKFYPKRPAVDTSPREFCALCETWVRSDQMSSHMRVIHIGAKKGNPRQSTLLPSTPPSARFQHPLPPKHLKTHCPDCGVSVQLRRLDRHLRKVHGKSSDPAIAAAPPIQSATPRAQQQKNASRQESTIAQRISLPARPAPRTQKRKTRSLPIATAPIARKRTGVYMDDETLSVEVEGKFIGTAGNVSEGWEMIAEYKRRQSSEAS
jgi:hypothetical protein